MSRRPGMNTTITTRERIDTALNHREPDRTPSFEYVLLSPLADLFLGRPYAGDRVNWNAFVEAKGWESAVRQAVVDRVDLAERLGHDMLYVPMNAPPPSEITMVSSDEPGIEDPVEVVRHRNQQVAMMPPCLTTVC